MRTYLFIDGGAFEATVSTFLNKHFQDRDIWELLNFRHVAYPYDRVFYYDAYPIQKKGMTDAEFEKLRQRKQGIFDVINRTPKCHVHTGETRHRKKTETGQEQKGVDVMLAIQVMQNAYMGNMDVAAILTNDLDFYPIFDALVQTRVSAQLLHGPMANKDLIESADIASLITYQKLSEWLKPPHGQRFAIRNTGTGEPPARKNIEIVQNTLLGPIEYGETLHESGFIAAIPGGQWWACGERAPLEEYLNSLSLT